MDDLQSRQRVYRPASWRYQTAGLLNHQRKDVRSKEIRRNSHGMEIFDDYFSDDDMESDDSSSVSHHEPEIKKTTQRKLKRMSNFSVVDSSTSDDELPNRSQFSKQNSVHDKDLPSTSSGIKKPRLSIDKMDRVSSRNSLQDLNLTKNTSGSKKPRVVVVSLSGKLIEVDECQQPELNSVRNEDQIFERQSRQDNEDQLNFTLPKPVAHMNRSRKLSSTPNNPQNNLIASPNLTQIENDDPFLDAPKRFSFCTARNVRCSIRESTGPNRSHKIIYQNQSVRNSLAISIGKQPEDRNDSRKNRDVEESANDSALLDLNKWHDGDFIIPPERRTFLLKKHHDNTNKKQDNSKKKKSNIQNIQKTDKNSSKITKTQSIAEWLDSDNSHDTHDGFNRLVESIVDNQENLEPLKEDNENEFMDDDVEDESLDGDYKENDERSDTNVRKVELQSQIVSSSYKNKNGKNVMVLTKGLDNSLILNGQMETEDDDNHSGYLEEDQSIVVPKTNIQTENSTKLRKKIVNKKSKKDLGAKKGNNEKKPPKANQKSPKKIQKKIVGETSLRRSKRLTSSSDADEVPNRKNKVEKNRATNPYKDIDGDKRNKQISPVKVVEEQVSRRDARSTNTSHEEDITNQVSGSSQKKKKASSQTAIEEPVLGCSLRSKKKSSDEVIEEQVSRKDPRSKKTSSDGGSDEPMLPISLPSPQISRTVSNGENIAGISHDSSPIADIDRHKNRRSKETSPVDVIEQQVARMGSLRIQISPVKVPEKQVAKKISQDKVIGEQVSGRGPASKKTIPDEVTNEQVSRRGPASKKTIPDKVTNEQVSRRGPASKKTIPDDVTNEHVSRRGPASKKTIPDEVTNEQVSRRGPASKKTIPDKEQVSRRGPASKKTIPDKVTKEQVSRRGPSSKKTISDKEQVSRRGPASKKTLPDKEQVSRRDPASKKIIPDKVTEEPVLETINPDMELGISPNTSSNEQFLEIGPDEQLLRRSHRSSANEATTSVLISPNLMNNKTPDSSVRTSPENVTPKRSLRNKARKNIIELRNKVRNIVSEKSNGGIKVKRVQPVNAEINRKTKQTTKFKVVKRTIARPSSSSSPDSSASESNDRRSATKSSRRSATKSSRRSVTKSRPRSRTKSRRRKTSKKTANKVENALCLKKQLIYPEENSDLRRSKRTRMPRLATWDWERPKYILDEDGFRVLHSISSPMPEPMRKRAEKPKKVKTKKKPVEENVDTERSDGDLVVDESVVEVAVQAMPVINPETKEVVYIDLISKFKSVQFCGPSGSPAKDTDPYLISLSLKHQAFSCGFLVVRPRCEKKSEHLKEHSLKFTVLGGRVLVTIHCTSLILKKNDEFLVPMGNRYRVQNLADADATLCFTRLFG